MQFNQSNTDVWTVYYQSPGKPEIYSETTTNLAVTVARLEAAGYIVIDEVND